MKIRFRLIRRNLRGGKFSCVDIEVDFDRDQNTRFYQFGGPQCVARRDLRALKQDVIDFSYASVPAGLVSLYQEIDAGRFITKQAQSNAFNETFETKPGPEEFNAFSEQARHSKENWILCSKIIVVMELAFERFEGCGFWYLVQVAKQFSPCRKPHDGCGNFKPFFR
ncbi:MAG: hypothetical protein JWM16_2320 [Verrucomicrobiales bacterium]|nr:hypothetical protein [Verrucomicrobiales bacterium]